MNTIRRITVGNEYTKGMHYILGQTINVLDAEYKIHSFLNSDNCFDIFIEKNKEVVKWKSLYKSLPLTIEYDIDF